RGHRARGAARPAALSRGSARVKAIRSITTDRLVVFFLLLVPFAGAARFRIQDPDVWWHLAQGEWIVRHGAVPAEDVFSYTAGGREWLWYSWLAEVLFHAIVDSVGFRGLVWLQAVVATATIGFVYLACRAAGARTAVGAVVVALAACSTAFAWFVRPLVFTLLFVAFLGWAIRSERLAAKLAWIAPPLLAVWANVHILFPAGVALLGFAAACRAFDGKPSRRLWIATGLSALATLANPYGWRLLGYVLVMARQGAVAPEVVEFHSPGFHGVFGLMVGGFLFVALATLAWSRERASAFDLGTFVGSLFLGLLMRRNMALFAILAAPVVAWHLERLLPAPKSPRDPEPRLLALNGALLLAGLGFAASCLPRSGDWRDHVQTEDLPIAAAELVAEKHQGARLLNDFNWGGYLIYRLFPKTRVAIDGRTPVYEHILRPYMRMHYAERGWDELLRACDSDVILWPADGPFASLLRRLPEWAVEYEDETAVIFVRAER
ncbi:MAG: hypothetical protein ACREQY_18580, partial [Candidatus Binatia bacterium]